MECKETRYGCQKIVAPLATERAERAEATASKPKWQLKQQQQLQPLQQQ